MSLSYNKQKEADFVRKKNTFRQQIRREYLDEYMSKKRADCFGWSHQDYLKTHQTNISNTPNLSNHDVEIDNYPPLVLQRPYSHHLKPQYNENYLKPQYNENYFQNMNLLQRMTQKNIETEFTEQSSSNQYNFRYMTLYQFLIEVIKQSLDHKYFQKFEDNRLFVKHFNALKHQIYQKIGEQIEEFLIQFNTIKKNLFHQEKESSREQSLNEVYRRLIYQIQNFLQAPNMQIQQSNQWPLISVEEQFVFLLKVLVQITYHDEPTKTQTIFYVIITRTQHEKIQQKYLNILESESDKEEYSSRSAASNYVVSNSVTEYLINQSYLLQRLKFLVVFGHSQHSIPQKSIDIFGSQKRVGSTQKNKKIREIKFILDLLSNIVFNVGSDILFETGIIGELKCLLMQPFEPSFTVNINPKRRGHSIPRIHQQIISFIVYAFQMVKDEQGLKYLSEMDSLSFVVESLVKVTLAKRELENMIEYREEKISVGNEFLFVDYKETSDECDNQCFEDDSTDQTSNRTQSSSQLKRLIMLAQKCIESIQFHFILGSKQTPNQDQQKQRLENRYLVKVRCLMQTNFEQDILRQYESGQQLIKRWAIIQN